MELMYTAEKKTAEAHSFAFSFASLPDDTEETIDGNVEDGVLDGNT